MKLSNLRLADRAEKQRAPKPRTHFLWWELNETLDQFQARTRAMIASGEANRNDSFVACTWHRPEDGDPAP